MNHLPALLLIAAIPFVLFCSNPNKPDNPDDSSSGTPRITTLSARSAMPASNLTISGTAFGPIAGLRVRFADTASGYAVDVQPVVATATGISVCVPPFIETSSGDFAAGMVGISVVRNPGADETVSNAIDSFMILDLPVPAAAAGTVTLTFLNNLAWVCESLAFSVSTDLSAPAAGCIYQLTPPQRQMPASGGDGAIMVTAEPGCDWTAESSSPSWITVTSGAGGSGDGAVLFSVLPNTAQEQREAVISVMDQDFIIIQAARTPVVTGPFDGTWTGTFGGIFTYISGSTYEYDNESLSISVTNGRITSNMPVFGSGSIEESGSGTWRATPPAV